MHLAVALVYFLFSHTNDLRKLCGCLSDFPQSTISQLTQLYPPQIRCIGKPSTPDSNCFKSLQQSCFTISGLPLQVFIKVSLDFRMTLLDVLLDGLDQKERLPPMIISLFESQNGLLCVTLPTGLVESSRIVSFRRDSGGGLYGFFFAVIFVLVFCPAWRQSSKVWV